MKISHYAIKHHVVISMVIIALIAFGIFCLIGLNVEFMPNMQLPSVEVITIYPGASAVDVERDVTNVLEKNFVQLPNFKSITSKNSDSLSWITVSYSDAVDPYDQLNEIRYQIDQLMANLPSGISGKPTAIVAGASMLPVFEFAIEHGADIGRVTEYVQDEVVPRLTSIEGVSGVTIVGGANLQVEVALNLDELQSKGISVLEVYQLLQYSNVSLPLGDGVYQGNQVTINFDGRLKNLDDLGNLTVGASEDGVLIKLRDVATIRYAYPEDMAKTIVDSKDVIMVSVSKRVDGNAMKIIKEAKKVLEQIEAESSGALSCRIITDDSKTIKTSLRTVVDSGVLGVVMAVLVILLFLGDSRATLIIGLSIPFSVLFTFIGLKVMGMSISLITVAALVVALGMIVDGSIVMLEECYRNIRTTKLKLSNAIIKGSDEVGASILASGLTTIVVFVPMIFLNGIVGMIIKDFAIALVISITASIFVAIIIVPYLLHTLIKDENKLRNKKVRIFDKVFAKIENGYKRLLNWSLENRPFIILLPIVLLMLSVLLVPAVGYTFIPSIDTGDFYASFEFPTGYTPQKTEEKMRDIETIVREQVPEAQTIAVYSSQNSNTSALGSSSARYGYVHIILSPSDDRDRGVKEIILDLQSVLSSEVTDARIEVYNGGFDKLLSWITDTNGYSVTLSGTDLNLMYETAQKIEESLKDCPSVVQTSINTNFNTVNVTLDMSQEYLSSLGLSSYEAGVVSRILFSGMDSGKLSIGDDRYNIFLTSDISDQSLSEDVLAKLVVKTALGDFVSFAGLGDFRVDNTINAINHTGRNRTITVNATLVGEDTSQVQNWVTDYLEKNPLPIGVEQVTSGVMKIILDSLSQVAVVMCISVFLVYMVMVIQFERFQQPWIIMLSVPFAIIGVILGLLGFGSNFNLLSTIAIISLAGIIVNNAIILVDFTNLLRNRKRAALLNYTTEDFVDTADSSIKSEDYSQEFIDKETEKVFLKQSVISGSASRLKPIAMTTLTTLFGMFPMALGMGEGAELYAPVGQAIFGGLFGSTLITLIFIPVVYFIVESRKINKTAEKRSVK